MLACYNCYGCKDFTLGRTERLLLCLEPSMPQVAHLSPVTSSRSWLAMAASTVVRLSPVTESTTESERQLRGVDACRSSPSLRA